MREDIRHWTATMLREPVPLIKAISRASQGLVSTLMGHGVVVAVANALLVQNKRVLHSISSCRPSFFRLGLIQCPFGVRWSLLVGTGVSWSRPND